MKIGEFALHYQRKKSTIRHYTDLNLLLPNREGRYPDYDEQCLEDMEDIIQLTTMGFTLDEIMKIKTFRRYMVSYKEDEATHIKGLFDGKMVETLTEIKSLENRLTQLRRYKEIHLNNEASEKTAGSSLLCLSSICCPECHSGLALEDAQIPNGQLLSGRFTCQCGVTLWMEDGLLFTSESSYHLHVHDFPRPQNLSDYYEMVNSNNMAIILEHGQQISHHFKQWDHSQGVFFPNADSDIVMMGLHRHFQEQGRYFFFSWSKNAMIRLKDRLYDLGTKGHFFFLTGTNQIPLKENIGYLFDLCGNGCEILFDQEPHHTLSLYNKLIPDLKALLHCSLHHPAPSKDEAYKPYFDITTYESQITPTHELIESVASDKFIKAPYLYPMLNSEYLWQSYALYEHK